MKPRLSFFLATRGFPLGAAFENTPTIKRATFSPLSAIVSLADDSNVHAKQTNCQECCRPINFSSAENGALLSIFEAIKRRATYVNELEFGAVLVVPPAQLAQNVVQLLRLVKTEHGALNGSRDPASRNTRH